MKRGFLIMPFSRDLDWLKEEVIASGLAVGVDFERGDDIFAPGVILDQILKAIDDADVIIAVCTGKNPNVFFELGYAFQRHSPILVAEDTNDLPFDVRHLRTELYGREDPGGHKKTLPARLKKAIRAILDEQPLPKGSRLTAPPRPKAQAKVTGRIHRTGTGTYRLTLTNSGTVDLHNLQVSVPSEAGSFHLHATELPVEIFRPTEQINLSASVTFGGGKSIFDLIVDATTAEGISVSFPIKISI